MGDAGRDLGNLCYGPRQASRGHGLGQDKREDAAHHRASRRVLGNHLRRVSVSPQDIEEGVLASSLLRGGTLGGSVLGACVRLLASLETSCSVFLRVVSFLA